MTSRPARNSESGYALLLVYAMAASIAIMLYLELPRVVFEAQRDREQLLIDRGEQYSRAVQLYVRKFNRFPVDMDALEKTQGMRFLRRKYVDPMTGKDDWRLIHVGPGGVFTDSLVHQSKDPKNPQQTFITEMQQIGGNAQGSTGGVNLAARTRPSDQAAPPGLPDGSAPAEPATPQAAGGPVMVLPDGRIVPANATGQAPAAASGPAQPGAVAGVQPPGQNGQPGQPGQPQAPGAIPGTAFNGLQTPNGIGIQSGGPPSGAADLINQILRSPRQQPGAQADQGASAGALGGISGGQQGQVIGGGFAGVASKAEQEGIKSYGDRSSYNEWEFVYDITKDPMKAAQNQLGASAGGRLNQQQTGQQNSQAAGAVPK